MSEFKDFLLENFKPKNTITTSNKPRIIFIDLAKGLCIILVVLMHNGFTLDLPLIKAVRMPLYFILSGFFFKDYGNFMNFLIKKTNRLIIPLLFFLFVGLIPTIFISSDISNLIKDPLTANFPLWFLLCLFWVNIYYFLIHATIKIIYIKSLIILIFGLVGAYLSYHDITLPFYFSSALSATPFFFVGILLRKLPILYNSDHDKAYLIIGIALLIATAAYCIFINNIGISYTVNKYKGGYVENLIISICGVIGLLLLCKAIKWLPIVSYMGRYSVIVLGMHIVFRNFAYLPIYAVTHHNFSHLEILILSLFLCWISIPIIKRWFPKFCAQQELFKLRTKNTKKTA